MDGPLHQVNNMLLSLQRLAPKLSPYVVPQSCQEILSNLSGIFDNSALAEQLLRQNRTVLSNL